MQSTVNTTVFRGCCTLQAFTYWYVPNTRSFPYVFKHHETRKGWMEGMGGLKK